MDVWQLLNIRLRKLGSFAKLRQNATMTATIEQCRIWAERARRQAEEATTPTARAIHIAIAEEYEAKAEIAQNQGMDSDERTLKRSPFGTRSS